MSRGHERAIEMVEHQLKQIEKSNHPDEGFIAGMIQANLAQGFISQAESIELEQRAIDAVSVRRRALQQQSAANRLAAYEQQYGRAS
jgi:hypothetical protein